MKSKFIMREWQTLYTEVRMEVIIQEEATQNHLLT